MSRAILVALALIIAGWLLASITQIDAIARVPLHAVAQRR